MVTYFRTRRVRLVAVGLFWVWVGFTGRARGPNALGALVVLLKAMSCPATKPLEGAEATKEKHVVASKKWGRLPPLDARMLLLTVTTPLDCFPLLQPVKILDVPSVKSA